MHRSLRGKDRRGEKPNDFRPHHDNHSSTPRLPEMFPKRRDEEGIRRRESGGRGREVRGQGATSSTSILIRAPALPSVRSKQPLNRPARETRNPSEESEPRKSRKVTEVRVGVEGRLCSDAPCSCDSLFFHGDLGFLFLSVNFRVFRGSDASLGLRTFCAVRFVVQLSSVFLPVFRLENLRGTRRL